MENKQEILLENNYSKCLLDENNKVDILLKENTNDVTLSVKEAADFCAEVIREYQIRKYGKAL